MTIPPWCLCKQDVRTIGANFTSVVAQSHIGFTSKLLNNPYHKVRGIGTLLPVVEAMADCVLMA